MTDSQPPIQTETTTAPWSVTQIREMHVAGEIQNMPDARHAISALLDEITRMKAEHRKEMNQTIRDAQQDVADARWDALRERDAY